MPISSDQEGNISVITIDLDDTLWDNEPTLENAEIELYFWLNKNIPEVTSSFSIMVFKTHRQEMAKQNL